MHLNIKRFSFIIIYLYIPYLVIFAQNKPKKDLKLSNPSGAIKSAFGKLQMTDFDKTPNPGTYEFRNIDFGKGIQVNGFIAKVRANYIPTGWIEIRLDKPCGRQIGMCLISQRDGGKDWYIAQTGIYPVEGKHSVFLVFTGSKPAGFNPQVEWFSFTKNDSKVAFVVGNTLIPPLVPYLGPLEKNFLGNGIAGAGGDSNGVWDYLIGPAYSSVSFIDEERVSVILNGKEYLLGKDIKRVRGTGIFLSTMEIEGISCSLIDFALQNTSFITRAVFVKNTTYVPVKIVIKTLIMPASNITCQINKNTGTKPSDETSLNMIAEEKFGMTISVNNSLSYSEASGKGFSIKTDEISIQPGQSFNTGFYHYAHQLNDKTNGIIEKIRKQDAEKDLESCILNWAGWQSEGISLAKVSDLRVKDVIEANAILLKMLQGEDGGIMTTPRVHRSSYIRDTHYALRGMIAMGHTKEAKKFLLWVHKKFKLLQSRGQFPIPNAANIGSDGIFAGFGNEENWSSETPGLYMLIAQNYFNKTNDLETLKNIGESLRFSMECQLDCAEKNGWKLPFNRDETESGGAGIKLMDLPGKWSMPSLLFCDASLQFFISYLEKIGETKQLGDYREKLKIIRSSLYTNFWNEKLGRYDWYRGEHGERSKLPIANYLMMPVYFNYPVSNRQLAVKSAENMKQYVNERGFIPNQPGNLHLDFCGHAQGYLLYAMAELNDPLKEKIFNSLMFSGAMGCWGTWGESYTGDGLSYGPAGGQQYWDDYSQVHNLRAFENGTNLDAILRYLNLNHWN